MKNLDKYRSLLTQPGDGLLLTGPYSRHYCAEYDISEGVAVITAGECRYFTDSRYIEDAQNHLPDFRVQEVTREQSYIALINRAIEELRLRRLGFEEDQLTAGEYTHYSANLRAQLMPMGKAIDAFRGTKEDWELEKMRKAQQITDRAFEQVLPLIRVGMTERELRAELICCLYRCGADAPSFAPIVVSGPNTSLPHGVPGDRKLREGDFVTMDFGALYQGYCADMTRTVALGYATEEMRKVYDTVLRAQLAGIAASRAGVPGKDIDAAARQVITDAGYGAYFGHGYGHSLGLQIHEAPNTNWANPEPMPLGAVASAEPGIYLPGKFGVRIEDVVIFRADGVENITQSPKNLMIL